MGGVDAVPIPLHGRPYSLTLTLPPLSMLLFKREAPAVEERGTAEETEVEAVEEIESSPEDPAEDSATQGASRLA